MTFGPFNEDDEIAAQDVKIFKELRVFGSVINDIFNRNGINLDSPQDWFPLQNFLDINHEISDTFGDATIFYIGRNVVEEAMWLPEIDSLEVALSSINEAYHMNHRGIKDIGFYEVKKTKNNQFIVIQTRLGNCP